MYEGKIVRWYELLFTALAIPIFALPLLFEPAHLHLLGETLFIGFPHLYSTGFL